MDASTSNGIWSAMRRAFLALVAAVTILELGNEPAQADIESDFGTRGSLAVTIDDDDQIDSEATNPCLSGAPLTAPATFVYPTNLGLGGFNVDHPIIVWGNGTDVSHSARPTCFYMPVLEHFASHGFVVVALNTGQSGTGNELIFAAAAMVGKSGDPSSIFYQKVDITHITAAGHSQGAIGAVNAALNAPPSLFSSVLAASIANRDAMVLYNDPTCGGGLFNAFCCAYIFGEDCVPVPVPERSRMDQLNAPIFFVRGSDLFTEFFTDQPKRDWYPTAAVPYAGATRVGATHFDLSAATGYVTAWLLYTSGYCAAAPAFIGASPEIDGKDATWTGSQTGTPPETDVTLQNLPTLGC
jgi:hypothetical protein